MVYIEPPVSSSFSIQEGELCRHITWVKGKLSPCFQGSVHNDLKAQAGIDTASVGSTGAEVLSSTLHPEGQHAVFQSTSR